MDRKTIGLVWVGGAVLMVALYYIGPQNFIHACAALVSSVWWYLGNLIDVLAGRAFDALRAAAIALYAVFLVLTILARRRGIRSGAAWVVVTALFLLLIETDWYDAGTKWFSAAVLTGAGAAVMTARLLHPSPPPRDPRFPWGPAGSPRRSDTTTT